MNKPQTTECCEHGVPLGRECLGCETLNSKTTREQDLDAALREVMEWISGWNPNFEEDPEWPATKKKVKEALAR